MDVSDVVVAHPPVIQLVIPVLLSAAILAGALGWRPNLVAHSSTQVVSGLKHSRRYEVLPSMPGGDYFDGHRFGISTDLR